MVAAGAAEFDLGRKFSAALLSGGFDHLIDDRERRDAMRNIARHLKPGARLFFDVFLGLIEETDLKPAGTVPLGIFEIRRRVAVKRLSPVRNLVFLLYKVFNWGRLQECIVQQPASRVCDRSSILKLLNQTGFTAKREFSDYEFTPFPVGDRLLVIEAVRK